MTQQQTIEQLVEHDLLGTYKSLAAQSGTYKAVLSELIDNAFDQEARTVTVTFDMRDSRSRTVTITDDGNGCDFLPLFVGLGQRRETRTNRIGRWGYGAKHALLWLAHDVACRLQIESLHKRTLFSVRTSFEQIAREGKLMVQSRAASSDTRPGTTLRLVGFRRAHVPTGKEMDRLLSELGFTYSRAVEDGRVMIVEEVARRGRRRHLIEPYRAPAFDREVRDEFALDARRSVRLHVGLVKAGEQNSKPALHYRYGYRVIEESSGKGCGSYGTSRIFGYVDLIGDWKLAALKDCVYEPGALHGEILSRIEPLLKAAQSQLMVAESAALLAELEQKVNASLSHDKRAKRDKGNQKGTKNPTGRGSKHTRAEKEQAGRTFGGSGGRLHVAFEDLQGTALGDYKGNTVRLNTSVLGVRAAREQGDVAALYLAVMMVYFTEKSADGAIDRERMIGVLDRVGFSMHGDARIDGKALVAPGAAA